MSVDYSKLKTNLNLIMHRLKLVEKKKMELNQKARRTVGEFLNGGKVDRARIRVEQIIREDYIIESMDIVESYCDFLLSRFGQLQSSEVVDEGLQTAVSSLIWVTPRFESDVPELKVIADQLGRKYGKQYVLAAKDNHLKTVNETLMKKMGVQAPSKVLVEKYLVEIAKDQKIDYKPDQRILKEQEANSTRPAAAYSSDEDEDRRQQTSANQPAAPQSGFNLIDLGDHYPRNPITQPYNPYGQPPPLPSEPPLGQADLTGLNDSTFEQSSASAPSAQLPIGFNLPPLNVSSSSSNQSRLSNATEKSSNTYSKQAKKEAEANKSGGGPSSGSGAATSAEGPPPNYDSVVNKPTNQTQYYSFGPDSVHHQSKDDLNDTLPELPPVPKDINDGPAPSSSGNAGPSTSNDEQLDFEDLTRRFEELRKK